MMLCIISLAANATEGLPWVLQFHYSTNTKATFNFSLPTDISLTVNANIPMTETYTDFTYFGGVLFDGTITVDRPAVLKISGEAGSCSYTRTLNKGTTKLTPSDGPYIENFNDQKIMQIYITIQYIND